MVGGAEEATDIIDVRQRSPLRLIFQQIIGAGVKEAVLINTAGGIACAPIAPVGREEP